MSDAMFICDHTTAHSLLKGLTIYQQEPIFYKYTIINVILLYMMEFKNIYVDFRWLTFIFMPPLKRGHLDLPLSLHPSVRPSLCPSVHLDLYLKKSHKKKTNFILNELKHVFVQILIKCFI